jgi:hypothetical protein
MSDLLKIPGVGKNMEKHFFDIGIKSVEDLKGKDPQKLFEESCKAEGCMIDRCVLYVYRLAVYYAQNDVHEAEKLKWWNWKD